MSGFRGPTGLPSRPGYGARLLPRPQGHPYQIDGTQWLAQLPYRSRCLADVMRAGKTMQWLLSLPRGARGLVFCPVIAKGVWARECLKWRDDLRPLASERLRRPAAGELLLLSHDSLPEPHRHWKSRLVPDELGDVFGCIDEAHAFKSGDAERTRRARLLRRQLMKFDGLTAGPLPGHPLDLWGILDTCGATWSFESQRAFLDGFGSEDWKARLRLVLLRRTLADIAPHLPPIQIQVIPLDISPSLARELDAFYTEWGTNAIDLPAVGAGSRVRRLLAESRIEDGLRLARGVLDKGEPLLVFSCHKEPVRAMTRIERSAYMTGDTPPEERARLVERFQHGDIQLLAMTVDTGGVSIKLSRASFVLELDQDWTPDVNLQAIFRAVSLDKLRPIHVYRVTSPHPLERRILELRAEKEALAERAFRA